MTENNFFELIAGIRARDERAAAELVRRYEAEIRREANFALRDPTLRRTFDSMDISQSVLGSFFSRAASGEYDLDRPEDLTRLLASMARNKVADAVRHHRAQRRDYRRTATLDGVDVAARSPEPGQVAEWRDLLASVQRLLSKEECHLADLRAQGREWTDVSEEMGGTPGGRRKQLTRALARVSRELGLDDAGA